MSIVYGGSVSTVPFVPLEKTSWISVSRVHEKENPSPNMSDAKMEEGRTETVEHVRDHHNPNGTVQLIDSKHVVLIPTPSRDPYGMLVPLRYFRFSRVP